MNRLDPSVTGDGQQSVALPSPTSQRWRPLRAGLLNLYRYDEQVFYFEQGRLLLRGHNGTGKSRVLALQLPFLLDADISPQRVEPDGDVAKRIEWNLLMNRTDIPDRLGYTWLEFGRIDEEGNEHYFTIGIALHAVAGRGAPKRWYFVLRDGRVGADLHLRNEHDRPLSRDALIEAIGEAGQVFDDRNEYRRTVDAALFKLGPARYRALMDLLIQLRQPQLSRDLDEKRLSAALSEALPPIEQRIIDDVADSFRELESDRIGLKRSEAAGAAVDAFFQKYRAYLRCAARRRAADVRTAHTEYEQAQRQLRAAQEQRGTAKASLDELSARLEALTGQVESADATARTLAASPEMRAADSLEQAHAFARTCRTAWEDRKADHDQTVRAQEAAEQDQSEAQQAATLANDELKSAEDAAALAAEHAGLADRHREALAAVRREDGEGEVTPSAIEQASRKVQQAIAHREEAIRRVHLLARAVQQAAEQLKSAKQAFADKQQELEEAVERERAAAEQVEAEGDALLTDYRAWADAAVELSPATANDLAEALQAWCETGDGHSPVRKAVDEAFARSQRALADRRASVEQQLAQAQQQIEQLQQQRKALVAGRHEPPAWPHTRGSEARGEGQRGAPLWSLIDFAQEVAEDDRAGLEAAMEAAGLLDAWVTPAGRLLDAQTLDTCIIAADAPLSADAPRLVDVLEPDDAALDAAGVAPHVVRDVLMRIGVGEGTAATWIDAQGAWRNGPLHGRWMKPAAQHIGQAARERHRLQQIADLDEQIAEVDASAQHLRASIDELDQRLEAAQREAETAPAEDRVRQALARRAAANEQVTHLRSRVTDAERRVQQAREKLTAAEQQRDRDAADLGITEWVDRLDDLRQATNTYQREAAQLWPAMRRRSDARQHARRAAKRLHEATEQVRVQADRLEAAAAELRKAEAQRDALESSVGQDARTIRKRLEEAQQRVANLREEHEAKKHEQDERRLAFELAKKEIEIQTEARDRHDARRAGAVESLGSLAKAGLLPVVTSELADEQGDPTSVTRSVELARRIESLLADVAGDDRAWARHQQEVHGHIQALTDALLPHDLRPQTTTIDDLTVVTVRYDQRDCSMPELRDALAEDAQARRTLLEEQERRVLEQTLIDEVANHLHERLREAERLVANINEQLTGRPMSTGMRIKFAWEPIEDGPAGLADARRRLLATGATWSADDRAALGQFLHEQLQAVRAADETATWQQQVEAAFDYRHWHRFAVLRQQEAGKWQRLTRRTHGTGSGGEKAVALTLPMFAAAAAHYQSADPLAPRPILLDEVFAGIDSDMRGKCMSLLEVFDLDFIMTSEREWGCYAELPGVAIYQITTHKGIDAVLATRWLWNGRQRTRSEPAPLEAPHLTPAADEDGLLP